MFFFFNYLTCAIPRPNYIRRFFSPIPPSFATLMQFSYSLVHYSSNSKLKHMVATVDLYKVKETASLLDICVHKNLYKLSFIA